MNIIKSALGFVTGSSKTVDDIFDKDKGLLTKMGGFINDLHLSDAEIIKANAELAISYNNFVKDSLSENTQRSKTRRSVADKWIALQVWLIKINVFAVFVDFISIRLELYSEYELTFAIAAIAFSGLLWTFTSGIGAFFFGTHLLRASKLSKGK